MKYGFCHLSIVPVRLEHADSSEMVSQILFGDHYKIIEERAKWVRVRNGFDKYEGWIDRKQVHEIDKSVYDKIHDEKFKYLAFDMAGLVQDGDRQMLPILIGSSLPHLDAHQNFNVSKSSYHYEGAVVKTEKKMQKANLAENAFMYLNAPYLWGGKTPFGIDCSGFAQMVYKLNGVALPRDAYQQAEVGQTLSFVEEAEPGDLAFFDNEEGRIIHVGILLENNQIIHASGKVRIDLIDHQGIYNRETNSYSHRLRLIKRIVK